MSCPRPDQAIIDRGDLIKIRDYFIDTDLSNSPEGYRCSYCSLWDCRTPTFEDWEAMEHSEDCPIAEMLEILNKALEQTE